MVKDCHNCRHGQFWMKEPSDPCLECLFYSEESMLNKWEPLLTLTKVEKEGLKGLIKGLNSIYNALKSAKEKGEPSEIFRESSGYRFGIECIMGWLNEDPDEFNFLKELYKR